MPYFTNIRTKFYYWHLLIALIIARYIFLTAIDYSQYLYISQDAIPKDLQGHLNLSDWNRLRSHGFYSFKLEFLKNFLHSSFDLIVIGFNLLPKSWDLLTAFTNEYFVDFFHPEDAFSRSVLFYALFRMLKFCIWIGPLLFYVRQPGQVFISVVQQSSPEVIQAAVYFGIISWMARGHKWIKAGALMAMVVLAFFVLTVVMGPLYHPRDKFPAGPLKERILALLASAGFNTNHLYYLPNWFNAGTAGVGQMAIVIVGGGLLELYKGFDNQTMAVIGHEIGHWKYYHSIVTWFYKSLVLVLSIAVYVVLVNRPRFYQAFDMQTADFVKYKTVPIGVGLILIEIITGELSVLVVPLLNYFGWLKEYACDSYSIKLGMGQDLHDGLAKMGIMSPLAVANLAFGLLHSTHPILAYRLAAVKRQL